jgi:plasmid maintenance system killer protein
MIRRFRHRGLRRLYEDGERIIFRFEQGEATDVDLVDYH